MDEKEKQKIINLSNKNKNSKGSKNKTEEKKKSNAGRKPKYDYWISEDGLFLIGCWARDGFTEEEIAKKMNIGVSTLSEWKNKFPELKETLKKNKEIVDYRVEASVLKSIMGFTETYDNQKVTKDGDVINYKETVYIPPNVLAQMFWLKNRQPHKWRDKVEITTNENDDKDNGIQIVNDAPKGEVKPNA